MPVDMRAVFITLSDAFRSMRQDGGGNLLDTLIESLEADAEAPPREVQGVSDAFLDELDRVPKKSLKKADSCPICGNPFLDGTLRHSIYLTYRKNLLKKKEAMPTPKDEEEDGDYDEMFA
ncbi:MAG: hypothetical protein Q9179_003594 [Wetmoreana sp. 5 TL-2023]